MPNLININFEKASWKLSDKINQSLKMLLTINVVQIFPWICLKKLFKKSWEILWNNQNLFLYGPLRKKDNISKRKLAFDKEFKYENKNCGVRDIEEINSIAIKNNFKLRKII